MKRITTLGLALGAAIAFAGAAQADIKMAVTGPLTGPNAAFGAQLKNGVEQAAGGIDVRDGRLDAVLELRAECGVRTGERTGHRSERRIRRAAQERRRAGRR